MKKFTYLLSFVLLTGLLTIGSCKKDAVGDKKNPGPEFSIDKFDTELKASIMPSGAIGWGYVITQNGLFTKGGAFGKSRNDADGARTFTLNRKVNIASVSKWITAIAVMQLLERRNLTPQAKVTTWLPPSWSKGPGVSELTFGELLGHTSGLSSYNTAFSQTLGWAGLSRMIDTGVVNSKNYNYLNANFALFRILIPSLWKGLSDAPAIPPALDSASTENAYIQYMQEHVFEPIGLTGIDCEPEARAIATLYYATTDLQVNSGVFYNSWKSICGGGGFFMTTMELARVLAYYRHTEILLSNEARQTMETNRFGYELKDDVRELHGNYFPKNGSIANTSGQGTYEQIVCFPNGVEVVVMFNTQGMVFAGGETNIRRAIYDAYNKSWQ